MAVTLQQLTNKWYDILREAESKTGSYWLEFMQDLMNGAELNICSWDVFDPFTQDVVSKWTLTFLNSDSFKTTVAQTSIRAEATVWWNTLTVASTAWYSTSWALFIRGNIVTYTWVTSTTFTWCSWVGFAFVEWTPVYQAFSLPDDFMSPIQLIYNWMSKIDMRQYDDIFEQKNWEKWMVGNYLNNVTQSFSDDVFYTIVWWYFVPFNLNLWGQQLHLRYEKLPTAMVATTDTCTIDNDIFALATIPYIWIWEMLYNRWEESRGGKLLSFWISKLKTMYRFYNKKSYENVSGVAYRTAKSWKKLNI